MDQKTISDSIGSQQRNRATPLRVPAPEPPGAKVPEPVMPQLVSGANVGIRPRWVGQFLGRGVLRVCPDGDKGDACAGCSLRVLCRCAQADFEASCRVEKRVWLVLAGCASAALLYCVL
jgi:hypothetical protein